MTSLFVWFIVTACIQ